MIHFFESKEGWLFTIERVLVFSLHKTVTVARETKRERKREKQKIDISPLLFPPK